MGALTMLDQSGDTTIHWTADRDDEMEAIIAKKMAEGCTFFIIDPRYGSRERLKDAREACRGRGASAAIACCRMRSRKRAA